MVIETKRLILRPFTVQDAEIYYEITREKDIQKFVPFACPTSLEETKNDIKLYYANGDFIHDFYFILEEKSLHQVIGAMIITQNFKKELDMSLLIASRYRKNGYMLEAIKGFISYIPTSTTLLFIVENQNTSSLALMSHLELQEIKSELKNQKKFVYVTH